MDTQYLHFLINDMYDIEDGDKCQYIQAERLIEPRDAATSAQSAQYRPRIITRYVNSRMTFIVGQCSTILNLTFL